MAKAASIDSNSSGTLDIKGHVVTVKRIAGVTSPAKGAAGSHDGKTDEGDEKGWAGKGSKAKK